ncbi:hypothetical protein BKI52_12175 [marine bacterium AO1-C]|nr:hypothetical protein BKI52_12175 [marine bacterium AO1-C]
MTTCTKKQEIGPEPSSANDKVFFAQLKKAGDEFAKGDIWQGYNFDKMPMYFIYRDADGTPTRGYVVNPAQVIFGAEKLSDAEGQGLNIYRYDLKMVHANNQLKAGNDFFDFYYNIDGVDYYLQAYDDEQIANDWAITFAVHECFHIFQRADWNPNPGIIFDRENYPLNADLLSYQLLLLKIAEKMPKETDQTKIRGYLEMYVALREEEMKIDPTSAKLVTFMANNQEEREGTARYIEHLIKSRILPNYTTNRPSFSSINLAQLTIQQQVRQAFGFSIWYGTGAAVIYMLANQGVDIEAQIQSNKNVYEVAVDHLNLTDAQKTAALNQAKVEFDWANIQQEAARLMALQ